MSDEEELDLRRRSRRVLFRTKPQENIPGAGTSAASRPDQHTRVKVTINLDGHVISYFKARAREEGCAYQTLINQALREYVTGSRPERLAREVRELLVADPSFVEKLAIALAKKPPEER